MSNLIVTNIGMLATPRGAGPKKGPEQGKIELLKDAWVLMEGGSVAQVFAVNAVPFAVLRCVSDGDGGGMDYETFAPRAARQSIDVVLRFLEYEVMV